MDAGLVFIWTLFQLTTLICSGMIYSDRKRDRLAERDRCVRIVKAVSRKVQLGAYRDSRIASPYQHIVDMIGCGDNVE